MTEMFEQMHKVACGMGERQDCAVKAVALACNVDYTTAHAAFAAHGRKPRSRTKNKITYSVIRALGFEYLEMDVPPDAKTMRTLPAAMQREGWGRGKYLVWVRGHLAAFVDGKVEDWSNNRCHRVRRVCAVVPAGAPAPQPEAAPKKQEATPGVRAGRTRPYLAGLIIARHGLATGVTDAMVAELDTEYGKANPRESRVALTYAWHVARGYAGIAEDSIA